MRTVALVVAIALGVAAAVGVRAYLQSMEREFESEQQLVQLAVPRRDIAAGEELSPGMVTEDAIPARSLMPDQITMQDVGRYYGREVRREVGRGIPLRVDHFIRMEPRRASAELPPGHRAVAISADLTSGVAGLIRPGNKVDIICTGMGEGGGRGAQETWLVLSDVTVLATDSRMSDLDDLHAGYDEFRRGYSTLTLSVTPAEAQLLIYLMNNARLSFSLRPEREVGETEPLPAVDGGNVRRLSEEANRQRQELLERAIE